MKLDRQTAMVTVCLMAAVVTSCKKDATAPEVKERTYSVTTTAPVPANPTAPITLQTNDPESQVQMTLDVAALQAMVAAAGGPVTVKMTDMAPKDYSSLSPYQQSQLGSPNEFLVLAVDVTRSSGAAFALRDDAEMARLGATLLSQTGNSGTTSFKVKNQSGRRCTPGKVTFVQVSQLQSLLVTNTLVIDDAFPIQNIVGQAFLANELLHYIMCWECPRTVPTTGAGR